MKIEKRKISELINDNAMYKTMSERCVEYVNNNHNIDEISLEIDSLLQSQLNNKYRLG